MGFKIEKPAPDVLKCARYSRPSIPPVVHLLSVLRPENDRDTSTGPPRYRSRRAQKSITVLSEVIERAPLALFDTYRRCPGDFGSPTCSLFIYFYSDIRKEKPILKKLFLILLRLGFFICRLTCGRLNSRYDVKIIFFFIYGLSLN